ncbi:MAG: hypothetical protein WAN21_01855, partial [Candidatus Sulfotelmatobacter sp.]
RRSGKKCRVPAGRGVGDQVSAHRYEFCIALSGPHSLLGGLQQGVRRVNTARMATLLQRGKGLLLVGRRRSRQD